MKYILQVDNREHQALQIIQTLQNNRKFTNIEYEVVPMILGDFAICMEDDKGNKKEIVIYERKSLEDLAASIKDGRYSEQSKRLDSLPIHNHNIVYLIEGSMSSYGRKRFTRMPASTLYSSMCSILFFKGFSMVRTFNIEETVTFVLQSFDKLYREKNKRELYYNHASFINNVERNDNNCNNCNNTNENVIMNWGGSSEQPNHNQDGDGDDQKMNIQVCVPNTDNPDTYRCENVKDEYVSVIRKVKKENLRPDNIGSIILSQIPGISSATSLAIMKKCGSLYNLLQKLSKDNDYLNDIVMVSTSGVRRKLSKRCIQSIKDYLLYGSDTSTTNRMIIDVED
jgi:hypothetical protein